MTRRILAALVFAVFAVSVGYSMVLPLLPDLLQRLLEGKGATTVVSRHTGLLTAAYALGLVLASPVWGRFSDVHGRRMTLLFGLLGFSGATAALALVGSLPALYAQRLLSGVFAAVAVPVASASIIDLTQADVHRGRYLAFVSMASVVGFLAGPSLGVVLTRPGVVFVERAPLATGITIPLAAMAVLPVLSAIIVARVVPNGRARASSTAATGTTPGPTDRTLSTLLALTLLVSGGIGVFEVGLALRGTLELGLTSSQLAVMFTECSLVMLIVQAAVFAPHARAGATRWLIAPALGVLAVGLVFVPRASTFWLMLIVVGGVAASAGILIPVLAFWISTRATDMQGRTMGRQSAAASLGIMLGSAAGGWLFTLAVVPGAPFVLSAGLVALGACVGVRLPRALVPGRRDPGAVTVGTP